MVAFFASLLVLCPAHERLQKDCNAARSHGSTLELELRAAARPPAPALAELQGPLTAHVATVLNGVTLFDSRPPSNAAGSTFQLRPGFGSKGPLAMFDLRF